MQRSGTTEELVRCLCWGVWCGSVLLHVLQQFYDSLVLLDDLLAVLVVLLALLPDQAQQRVSAALPTGLRRSQAVAGGGCSTAGWRGGAALVRGPT